MEFSGTRLPELEVLLLLGKSFLTSGQLKTSGFKFIQHGFPSLKNFEINSKTLQICVFSRGRSHIPPLEKGHSMLQKTPLGWGYVGSKFLSHLQALHSAVQLQRCDWYPPGDVGWPH